MKFQTALAVASAALPVALAQTWTDCNPLEKTCPCNPALGQTYTFDFTQGKPSEIFTAESWFDVKYKSDGVHLGVGKKGDAPTIASTKYILGGRLDAVLKIAPGKGIVSSLVFQSADLDEIDFEWVGSKPTEALSNYFGKGNTEQYNRGQTHITSDSAVNFHKYSIEWTKEKIQWFVDDKLLRTLTPADSADLYGSNNYYPQTPMQIKIGSWAAGDPSNQPGVIEWADGPIDYSKGPFEMVIKSITLTDFTTSAKSYCYGDKTGSWDSIVLSNSEVAGDKSKTSKPSTSVVVDDGKKEKTTSTKPPTKETTLSTSKSEKESTSTSHSSKAPKKATTTMEIAPAITQGLPDSIGNEKPQNKGVSSSESAASETAAAQTSAPAATDAPSSASSVRAAGFGGMVAVIIAALVL